MNNHWLEQVITNQSSRSVNITLVLVPQMFNSVAPDALTEMGTMINNFIENSKLTIPSLSKMNYSFIHLPNRLSPRGVAGKWLMCYTIKSKLKSSQVCFSHFSGSEHVAQGERLPSPVGGWLWVQLSSLPTRCSCGHAACTADVRWRM